jgi:hypothetical protein
MDCGWSLKCRMESKAGSEDMSLQPLLDPLPICPESAPPSEIASSGRLSINSTINFIQTIFVSKHSTR